MDTNQQVQNLFSNSMNVTTERTLFHDDLPHNSDNHSFHSDTTSEDHSLKEDTYPSDCESGITGSHNERIPDRGVVRTSEGDNILDIIKKKFVTSLGSYGYAAEVETIKRNDYSCIMTRVKVKSFCLYSRGVEIKRNGNANVKYAWYGASKDELNSILSHGFSGLPDTGLYGQGVYLSPVDHPIESVHSSIADENGLMHMLLCRVILGNIETIRPGSGQCSPSSEEFDSGVDNLVSPKKYIIWKGNVNTHILPGFVLSFRDSSYSTVFRKISQPQRRPNSDWMSFAALVCDLSKYLAPDAIKLISKHHWDYKKQKITRLEMIRQLRQLAGDKLLIALIKSHRQIKESVIAAHQ